jgi:NADPH:quinone reductase-like Zn-dependent oxidoreductase
MRAVVQTRVGGPEVLEAQDRPEPELGDRDVRIAVRAAGVNFADTMARTGLYPHAPKPPCVLGYEVSGTVEAVGPAVTGVQVGQRVMAGTRFGGQAEIVVVPEDNVLPLPDRLSFEQGAAFVVNYATAYAALYVLGGMREGDRVLIHAAAGGVGLAATQLARNAGAEVFGTASVGKHDAIRQHGVHHPIDYRTTDFAVEVRRILGGQRRCLDLVIDALGPSTYRQDYGLLRTGGRLVMYGLSEAFDERGRNLRGLVRSLVRMPTATMPWWNATRMLNTNRGVASMNLLTWWDRDGNLDRLIRPVLADLADGRLEPVVSEAFPFSRAADAHRSLAERRNIGKVVLVPDEVSRQGTAAPRRSTPPGG